MDNQIVISFAGTNAEMFDLDWIADINLATMPVCDQQFAGSCRLLSGDQKEQPGGVNHLHHRRMAT